MILYNPANWYWVVADDTSRAWSSAGAAYAPATDATYAAWLAAGNSATRIDNEADLAAVLQQACPAGLGALASYLPVVLTFLQFMALFASAEQVAIVNSSDPQVRLFLLMASGAGQIELAVPEVASDVNYLASAGLIASGRPAQILANQPPG